MRNSLRRATVVLGAALLAAWFIQLVLAPERPEGWIHKHAQLPEGMSDRLHQNQAPETVQQESERHDPTACAPIYVPEDRRGPRVPCECFHEVDPCDEKETRACAAYCDKKKCGCCDPDIAEKEKHKKKHEK